MGPTLISNPNGVNAGGVTDYRIFRATDGFDLELGKGEEYVLRANATILRGQCLELVVPTATVPLSVTPMLAATAVQLFAGVALESAVAGEDVPFVRRGFVIAFTDDSDTPAFGQVLLKPDATTGQFATAAAAATLQNVLGVVLSAEMDGAGLRKSAVLLDPTLGTINAAS